MRSYKVKHGDCLAKIASDFGFADLCEIYDHPANAEYKKKRPNPHVIKAGDQFVIPDKKAPKVFQCETGQEHTFVMKRPTCHLILHVNDGVRPFANQRYILTAGAQQLTGSTDSTGLVSQPVPPSARSAELYFPDRDVTFDVKLGDLDPISEVSGLRQRLENLGFGSDDRSGFELDGEDDEAEEAGSATIEAMRRFQVEYRLEATGEPNAETVARLTELHDKGARS